MASENSPAPRNGRSAASKMKAMHWVFTAFKEEKPTVGDIFEADIASIPFTIAREVDDKLTRMEQLGMRIRYFVFQIETAPETGKHHAQGYVEFEVQHRRSALKKVCPKWHFEPRSGTRDEARAYCMKQESYVAGTRREHGTWIAGRGARSDLNGFAAAIIEDGLETAAREMPGMFIRYHRGARELVETLAAPEPIVKEMEVTVYWGDTGTGKTWRAVHEAAALGDWWMASAPSNGNWYAYGYNGQRNVIFDDFRGSWMRISRLLTLLDKYRTMVNVSGRGAPWKATRVWITSNLHPREWYSAETVPEASRLALMRRLGSVVRVMPRLGSA